MSRPSFIEYPECMEKQAEGVYVCRRYGFRTRNAVPPIRCQCPHFKTGTTTQIVEAKITQDICGTGTELKNIFASFNIHPDNKCNCEAIVLEMNQRGPDWCEGNIENLVDRIEEESKKRRWAKYVFSRFVVKRLIKLAIRRDRRKVEKQK